MENALFSLENSTIKINGHTILSEFSLSIEKGEKITLVGQSGAGKSTLLTQLYQLNDSEVALVPQELGLVQNLSVFHNIYMGRLNHYRTYYNILNLIKPLKKELEKVRPIVEKLGLTDKLFTSVQELSGGQQQRLCIARAIAISPEVILMDEPCSALDPIATAKVEELIDELKEDFTIAIVTHNMQQAARVSQFTAFFHLGKLVEFGNTETILTKPEKKRTQDYVTGRFG